jgi:hypothetical protein
MPARFLVPLPALLRLLNKEYAMLRLPSAFAIAVLTMTLAVSLAHGQPSPAEDGSRVGPARTGKIGQWRQRHSLGNFLRLPQVQADLALSDSQKRKIQQSQDQLLRERTSKSGQGGRAITPFEEIDKEQQRLANILSPGQMKRLEQISLQALGPAALTNSDVVQALGISDQQKEKLIQLNNRAGERQRKILQSQAKLSAEQRTEEMAKIQRRLMEDALGVLTPEQHEKFEKLTGKKIDLAPRTRSTEDSR